MKTFILTLLVLISTLGQSQVNLFWYPNRDKGGFTKWARTPGGGLESYTRVNIGGSVLPAGIVQLPLIWDNPNECNSAFTYELRFPGTWISSVPSTGFAGFPYANTQAGLQIAINDMEAYRTANGLGVKMDIPPGLYSGAPGIAIPQSNTVASTTCLILASSQDSHLPDGTIVCERGMQDNLPTSTDILINNPTCTSPNDVQWMWTLETTAINAPLKSCSPTATSSLPKCASATLAPDHWLISGLEARPMAGMNGEVTPIDFGANLGETSITQLPNHIHLRKVWAHGDWTSLTTTANSGHNSITNDITFSVINGSIEDSFTSQSLRPGSEGHALGMSLGSQDTIDHNVFEGQASGLFCGGFAQAIPIPGYYPCQDMQVRRNRFTFPAAWLGVSRLPPSATWPCNPNCFAILRKNSSELKVGNRFLWAGNIGENTDNGGGQNGIVGLSLTVRNTSAGAFGANYTNTIQNITYEDSIGRNACTEASQAAQSGLSNNGGGIATPMRNILWSNFIYYNIQHTNPACSNASTSDFVLASVIYSWQGTVTRDATGTIATATLTCTPMVAGNCPAGPVPVGFETTNLAVSDMLAIQSCTDVSFNTPSDSTTWPGHPSPALGVGALNGTSLLTIVYPSVGIPNTSDNSNTCVFSTQGWPKNFIITHGTIISDAARAFGGGNGFNGVGGGPMYAKNGLIRDSIILGGGWASSVLEGAQTEKILFDFTSLTTDHMVWPGRVASKYLDFGNNLLAPLGSCSTPGGCVPSTAYYPATPNCTGAPTSSCVAFKGALNTSSMNLNLSDYHLYALCTSTDSVCSNIASIFAAGAVNQASDGAAIGFNPAAVDAAQTAPIYVCKTQCGTQPFSD